MEAKWQGAEKKEREKENEPTDVDACFIKDECATKQ